MEISSILSPWLFMNTAAKNVNHGLSKSRRMISPKLLSVKNVAVKQTKSSLLQSARGKAISAIHVRMAVTVMVLREGLEPPRLLGTAF